MVFAMFDVDGDGVISALDLRRILDMMVGKSLSPETAAAVVSRTLEEADADNDGRISFEDFDQVRS